MTDRQIPTTGNPTNDEDLPMNTINQDNNTQDNSTLDDAAALRRAKVEALQQRRAAAAGDEATTEHRTASRSRGRKSVAQGSKIAATAVGITAMLGLVGAMGAAAKASATPAAPATAVPAQVVVVIHPAGSASTSPMTATATGAVLASSTQPIALSAQPVVRQAAASTAPVAKTHGSR
jgi:hypothetical protein